AQSYPDDVTEEIKEQRLNELMAVQQQISEEIAAARVGQTMPVMIDGRENDCYVGRTEFDSPEVDGVVYVTAPVGRRLRRGCIYNVVITDSNEFDLYAEFKE
ncbi:MAG: 30S ribosomal protein S12 methylthiotransferase RimO, partial [Bacteroidaceae bacterium]|nr:30S ribosomal protein S12 methylthiotransferase RimO [Bacteroidaceae bacterium]